MMVVDVVKLKFMKQYQLFLVIFLLAQCISAQESLDDLLKRHNKNNVPYITVQELAMPKTNAIILDARELNEYKVSHLNEAIHVGYDEFQLETLENTIPKKDQSIVVYCSIGIRSEVIADQLKKAGYTKVKNLYGGIFEWKNNDYKIYNATQIETDSVHIYSKTWSKWLKKGIKVYE